MPPPTGDGDVPLVHVVVSTDRLRLHVDLRYALAIDVGDEATAAAVFQGDRVWSLPLGADAASIPSSVRVDESGCLTAAVERDDGVTGFVKKLGTAHSIQVDGRLYRPEHAVAAMAAHAASVVQRAERGGVSLLPPPEVLVLTYRPGYAYRRESWPSRLLRYGKAVSSGAKKTQDILGKTGLLARIPGLRIALRTVAKGLPKLWQQPVRAWRWWRWLRGAPPPDLASPYPESFKRYWKAMGGVARANLVRRVGALSDAQAVAWFQEAPSKERPGETIAVFDLDAGALRASLLRSGPSGYAQLHAETIQLPSGEALEERVAAVQRSVEDALGEVIARFPAGLTPRRVINMGRATQTPYFREAVRSRFPSAQISEILEEGAVALGAARWAGTLLAREGQEDEQNREEREQREPSSQKGAESMSKPTPAGVGAVVSAAISIALVGALAAGTGAAVAAQGGPTRFHSVHLPGPVLQEVSNTEGAVVRFEPPLWTTDDGQEVAAECEPPSGSSFPLGETVVTCFALHSSEEAPSHEFLVTMVDEAPPEIEAPAVVTQEAVGPEGAKVEFDVAAQDAVDGEMPVICDPPSGGEFPVGRTTVRCEAVDDSGNSAETSFTVVVTPPPTITAVTGVFLARAQGAIGFDDHNSIGVDFGEPIDSASVQTSDFVVQYEDGTERPPVAVKPFDTFALLQVDPELGSGETPIVRIVDTIATSDGASVTGMSVRTRDRISPGLMVRLSGGSGQGEPPNDASGLTKDAMQIVINADEPLEGAPSVEVFRAGAPDEPETTLTAAPVSVRTWRATFEVPADTLDGLKAVRVTGADSSPARNKRVVGEADPTAPGAITFRVDTTRPTGRFSISGDTAAPFETERVRPRITLSYPEAVTLTEARLDGRDVLGDFTTVDSKRFIFVPGFDLPPGAHALSYRSVDQAGNPSLLQTVKFQVRAPLPESFSLKLEAGWNAVSLPSDPQDPAVDSVFSHPAITRVATYESETDSYRIAERNSETGEVNGDLTQITGGRGYWVESSRVLVVTTELAVTTAETAIPVVKGWNHLGVVGDPNDPAPADPDAYFRAHGLPWSAAVYLGYTSQTRMRAWALGADPSAVDDVPDPILGPVPPGRITTKLSNLERGAAYWVWVNEDGEYVLFH